MISEKISAIFGIKLQKRTKRIIATALITFAVFLFFIWLGVGYYASVPESGREDLWKIAMLHCVFPVLIFFFGVKRVFGILRGEEGPEAPENEPESEKNVFSENNI